MRKFYMVILLIAGLFAVAISFCIREQELSTNLIYVYVRVKQGDTLWSIAKWSGISTERIYDANPQLTGPNNLIEGEDIRLPDSDEQLANRILPAAPQKTFSTTPVASASLPSQVPGRIYQSAASITYIGSSVWSRLAQCESSGNWADNTGNGYYGGLQFALSSWRAVGGGGLPSDASPAEQIERAQLLLARQGWRAWPECSAKLGL